MPSYVKEIPYIPVCEMDLSSAKKRYSTLGEQGSVTPDHRERANVQATTAEEQANFFEIISMCGIKPAILSIEKKEKMLAVLFGIRCKKCLQNKVMPKKMLALSVRD